ncbi:MAG TPA: molybdate ABC transporter substrate-binding protein [Stellaceae bacterium]|nr:molybdate ABC transporter substrate-binding protein [Stellaceae bacterium]
MSILRNTIVAGLVLLAPHLGGVSAAYADYPVAPDVVLFCEPTLRHAVADVAALWQKQTDVPVRVFTSPTSAMLQQIAHHARDDVIIGEGEAAAATASAHQLIKRETLRHLWRNELVVAARGVDVEKASAGEKASTGPPGGTGKLAALAGKAPIAIVDPWAATAGADSEKALQSLGLWQAVGENSTGVVDTEDASFLLTQAKVQLAIVYATDVASNSALAVADRLPAASYPPIVYWVAQTEHALSPNAAKFIAFLRSANAQQRVRADGLEVLP